MHTEAVTSRDELLIVPVMYKGTVLCYQWVRTVILEGGKAERNRITGLAGFTGRSSERQRLAGKFGRGGG